MIGKLTILTNMVIVSCLHTSYSNFQLQKLYTPPIYLEQQHKMECQKKIMFHSLYYAQGSRGQYKQFSDCLTIDYPDRKIS